MQQILVQEGETVDVGTRLAVIGAPGAAPAESSDGAAPAAEEPARAGDRPGSRRARLRRAPRLPTPQEPEAAPPNHPPRHPHPHPPAEPGANGDGKSFVSPVVARIASEHGVDVSQVPGTGRGGRVTKKDILGFVESGGQAAQPAAEARLRPRRRRRPHPPRRPRSRPPPELAPAQPAQPPPPPTPAPAPHPLLPRPPGSSRPARTRSR